MNTTEKRTNNTTLPKGVTTIQSIIQELVTDESQLIKLIAEQVAQNIKHKRNYEPGERTQVGRLKK